VRIAVPISKNNNGAEISARFSRSPYFAIIDKELNKTEIIENCYFDQKFGAGKAIVEHLEKKYNVGSFAAFEIGLKVQQIASDKKIQLIILHTQVKTLLQLHTIIKQ